MTNEIKAQNALTEPSDLIEYAEEIRDGHGRDLAADAGIDVSDHVWNFPCFGATVVAAIEDGLKEWMGEHMGDVLDEINAMDVDTRRRIVRIAAEVAEKQLDLYNAIERYL
jgi:hypothetical protein